MGMAAEVDKLWVKERQHAEERQEADDKDYEKGFRGYLKGFLAVEHNFDWSNFGADIVIWMEQFKVSEAEAIAVKRTEHLANLAQVTRHEVEPTPTTAPASTSGEKDKEVEDASKDISSTKSQEAPLEKQVAL